MRLAAVWQRRNRLLRRVTSRLARLRGLQSLVEGSRTLQEEIECVL